MSAASSGWQNRYGVVTVASTYVFFLIFAQYGFLRLLEARLAGGVVVGRQAQELRPIMAVMALAGLLASFTTPILLVRIPSRNVLSFAFVACTFTSAFALLANNAVDFFLVAALIGSCLGLLTVTLAADLRSLLPASRYGLAIGTGTGLAYLICNLPPLFEGRPELQTSVAGLATLLGFVAATMAPRQNRSPVLEPDRKALGPADCRGLGFASIIVAFLALVWVDSAAFTIIQETLSLKSDTWGSPGQKLIIGSTHLLAAMLGGWLIDHGVFRALQVTAFLLFVVSFSQLAAHASLMVLAGPIYAVGISLYSVALVAYPSFVDDGHGLVPRRWRAAFVYGIGGWLASALGIGMAQDLHLIPNWFLVAAGALIFSAWLLPRPEVLPWLRDVAHLFGGALSIAGLAGLAVLATSLSHQVLSGNQTTRAQLRATVDLGREVYIAEGCINCHSQYVRPEGQDVAWWGPVSTTTNTSATSASPSPPLLGNRRQGPDLTNVGKRRSALWQELHLRRPRSVSPGSRMPPYEHLFDDHRGDSLVAYLTNLGTENGADHLLHEGKLDPETFATASVSRGRDHFETFCSRCHGANADGAGEQPEALRQLAKTVAPKLGYQLRRPAMNLRKQGFWLVNWGGDAAPIEQELARLIRYGVPGTSMPGHESFTDQQIADLTRFVITLPGTSNGPLVMMGSLEP